MSEIKQAAGDLNAASIKPIVKDGVPWCDAGCPQEYDRTVFNNGSLADWHCRFDQVNRCHRDICPHAVRRMADELDVNEKLLKERDRLLDNLTPCPAHGRGCVPGAIEQHERMTVELEAWRSGLVELATVGGERVFLVFKNGGKGWYFDTIKDAVDALIEEE